MVTTVAFQDTNLTPSTLLILNDLNRLAFKFVDYLLGIVGIIIFTIVFFPITLVALIIAWSLLHYTIKKINIAKKDIYNDINTSTQKKIIESHLDVERAKMELLRIQNVKFSDDFFLLRPLNKKYIQLIQTVEDVEITLKNAAYPKLNKPINKEQFIRLKETFSDAKDWHDPNLDIYQNEYM